MRLPYVPDPPPTSSATDAAIVERVRTRRGKRGLVELDLALLHAPAVADGWNSFLGAIRERTTLDAAVRELAICRVAALNHAEYEWGHHFPLLQEAMAGLTPRVADYVRNAAPVSALASAANAVESLGMSLPGVESRFLVVLAYTDAMTKEVKVPEEIFKAVQAVFDHQQVVELTATIGAYNCVSRFLVALDVGEAQWQSALAGSKQ